MGIAAALKRCRGGDFAAAAYGQSSRYQQNPKKYRGFFHILLPFACLFDYYGYILFLNRRQDKNMISKQMKKICRMMMLAILCLQIPAVWANEKGVNIYHTPRQAPSKVIYSETGSKVKLSDFDGDFVLAVFWSRHCTPCLREIESLNAFARQTRDDGIRVIMISPKKEWQGGFSEQRRLLKKFGGNDLEMYVDDKNDMASALGIFSSPVTVLISREGKEIGRIRGSADWDSPQVIEYIYKIKAEHG